MQRHFFSGCLRFLEMLNWGLMAEKEKAKVKVAPNSKESEMMVLGCMLTKVNSLNVAADALYAQDFYYTEHQIIFDVLKALFKSDKPADIHLVAEELKRVEKLESIGGVGYLTTLAQYAGTSAYIEEYVELIKNKSILRRMIYAAQEIEKGALEEPSDVHGALDDAQATFFAISQQTNATAGKHIKDIISGVKAESGLPYLKELEGRQEAYLEKGEDALAFTGVPTGFSDLDKIINGLAASNLIILAGRPGMGKTAFALNVAEHVAFNHKMPVGIFSLEMSAEQLLHRMICSQSEVESSKIQTGSLNGAEFQRVVESINSMQKTSLIIDDQPGLKITDLRARARRMKEAHNIQLLVIDYLQLLSGSGSYSNSDSRQHEISEISRLLKNLARELNIPVLCGSQLSRKVEERTGHRPMMSDLRESGAIEQDADIVMFLLRREYYDPYDKPGLAEVIIGKNRHGKVGSIEVAYRKEFAQFANYTPTDETDSDNSEAFEAFSPR
jgi:replicative DNA helicase